MKFKFHRRSIFRGEVSGKPKDKKDHIEVTLKSGPVKVNTRIYGPGLIDQILHKDYLEASGDLYIKNTLNSYEKQTDGYIHIDSINRIDRYKSGELIEEERVLMDVNQFWRDNNGS